MNDHPFLRFIDLVTFDKTIHSIETEQIKIAEDIVAGEKQQEELRCSVDEAEKKAIQLKKRVDDQELEMKTLDQKEKEKKQQLDSLSDYREYQAIKAEVESIQLAQVGQEKTVLDAWNQLENAQSDFKKKKQESVEQEEKLQHTLNEMQQKQKELSMDFYKLVEQRKAKEGLVPVEWLEKYEMMRSRVADPVVQVTQDSCGSCYQMLTSQDLVRARRGALIQCRKCFRLLYLPEIMGT